ncbi:polysaccharide deacetylase family protein [Kitasatospora sp. NBC_00374]|uniref:polysaccharide deacetylase family protein n=1 Tax=Kitasatospora sp. NBC_00374 TaxID=2975964 RepID=UPI00324F176E
MTIGSSVRHRRILIPFAAALLLAAATACAGPPAADQAAAPPERTPRSGDPAPPDHHSAVLPGRAGQEEDNAQAAVARQASVRGQKLAAAQRWGLAAPPRTAPPPPGTRPALIAGTNVLLHDGVPPVVYRVPTDQPVVFLTIDDGAEKDRELVRMLDDLKIPVSIFLSDYLARADYGYFRELQEQGAGINNHTINHPDLRRLDAAQQQQEICGQQDRLERELDTRPALFRPPYGEYTDATLQTAAGCGIRAIPLWTEEAFPDRIEWRYDDQRLHPGDIILTHFRAPGADWQGTMAQMLRRVIDTATAQGFALAGLDDYL